MTKIDPEHIKRLREEKGWSRNTLAQNLGVDPSTVTRWERGDSPPTGTAALVLGAATAKFAAQSAAIGSFLPGPGVAVGAAAGLFGMLAASIVETGIDGRSLVQNLLDDPGSGHRRGT